MKVMHALGEEIAVLTGQISRIETIHSHAANKFMGSLAIHISSFESPAQYWRRDCSVSPVFDLPAAVQFGRHVQGCAAFNQNGMRLILSEVVGRVSAVETFSSLKLVC